MYINGLFSQLSDDEQQRKEDRVMPSFPFLSQWMYIQNCVSEVPPGGSGNKGVHVTPDL